MVMQLNICQHYCSVLMVWRSSHHSVPQGWCKLYLFLCSKLSLIICRIIPRHRYVQLVRAEPVHPFPMNYLKMSDSKFASSVANTPLPKFERFKADLVTGLKR